MVSGETVDVSMERIRRDCVEEDRIWGEMSETAKREGMLSHEGSLRLLDRMKNA